MDWAEVFAADLKYLLLTFAAAILPNVNLGLAEVEQEYVSTGLAQPRGAIYCFKGFARLAAKVLSGSLVLPR